MAQTKEEKRELIAALLEERRGYVVRGLDGRVAEVDETLRRFGAAGSPPAKRSVKRTSGKGVTR